MISSNWLALSRQCRYCRYKLGYTVLSIKQSHNIYYFRSPPPCRSTHSNVTVFQKSATAVPHARTWLRGIGVIQSPAQIQNNTTIFPIQAIQYIGSSLRLIAEFDITIRHDTDKKSYTREQNSKSWFQGIHNNKLYVWAP